MRIALAVTDEHGAFTLPLLPPGPHELVAWHEVYGESRKRLVLQPGGTATVEFTFEAPRD